MATKPDAARGKTTREGKIRKIFNRLKEEQKGNKPLGMSPGALGGRTRRQVPPPTPRFDRTPPKRKEFGDDLENIRGRSDKIAEAIIGTFPMIGTAAANLTKEGLPKRRPRKEARGGKMSTGGEVDVIDMTTEIDV